jgi:hypothetical protein
LNAHLERLKSSFSKVDDFSDLSTFRWDIVDPGGLPVGSANMPPLPGEVVPQENSLPEPVLVESSPEPAIERHSIVNDEPQGISLPIRKSPLRPTRGGQVFHRSRGLGRTSLSTRPPVSPSGLRPANFMDQQPMVIIESAPPAGFPVSSRNRRRKDVSDEMDTSTPSHRPGRPRKSIANEDERPGSLPRRFRRPLKNASNPSTPEPPLKRGPGYPSRSLL